MPKISVIVTTIRSSLILSTLKGILAQTFDDYEVLLIDNGMERIVPEILDLIRESKGKLHYFIEPSKGKSKAVNKGIAHARGSIIAFTDDDVVVDSQWLSAINHCFEHLRCDGIGGRVLPIFPAQTPRWVREHPRQMAGTVVIYDHGNEVIPASMALERFIGCNWAFKKEVFDICGLFRTDLGPGMEIMGEDEEFYYRVLAHDLRMYYCPRVIIHHPVDLHRLSLKHVSRWHICLGRFEVHKQQELQHKHFTYWFGVPRYLYKGITLDFLRLCVSALYRPALHHACRNFFCKVGMAYEYRHLYKEGRLSLT